MMRVRIIAGTMFVLMVALAQMARSASDGQNVSTNNWATTTSANDCVVNSTAALKSAGFKHITSGKTHKDGSVVLFADHNEYQATVFCMNKYMAMEVTGPKDAPASTLRDAFTKAWGNE